MAIPFRGVWRVQTVANILASFRSAGPADARRGGRTKQACEAPRTDGVQLRARADSDATRRDNILCTMVERFSSF